MYSFSSNHIRIVPGYPGVRPWVRRGFFLYIVLALTVLTSVFVLAFLQYMQGESLASRNVVQREKVNALARAGIAAGIGAFTSEKGQTTIRKALFSPNPLPKEGLTDYLLVETHPALSPLLKRIGDCADLTVELAITAPRPLFDDNISPSGIVRDPLERSCILRVSAAASYGDTHSLLTAHRRVVVTRSLPPVVSKFTLFVGKMVSLASGSPTTATSNSLNTIVLKKRSPVEGSRDTSASKTGLMTLFHGDEMKVEDRGWTFLGGGPIYLNPAMGQSADGEGHLFHSWPPYEVKFQVPPAPPFTIQAIEQGFCKGTFTALERYDFQQPTGDPMTDNCSMFRLMGHFPRPSPTVVFGQVFRRVIRVFFAYDGKYTYLPFVGPGDWEAPPGSWWDKHLGPKDVRERAFGGNYNTYAPAMSRVDSLGGYNLFVDRIVPPPGPDLNVLDNLEKVKHLKTPKKTFLYAPAKNTGHIKLFHANGKALFEGNLHDIKSEDIQRRSVVTMKTTEFMTMISRVGCSFPGLVYLKGKEEFVITNHINLESGGLIACEGSINITAPIKVNENGRPLVLYSESGDITISTKEKIEASLVALNGTLKRGVAGPLSVKGNVVLGYLDPLTLLKGGKNDMVIEYDDRLDPTRETPFSKLGVFLSPNWIIYKE